MTPPVPEQRREGETPDAYVTRVFRTCNTCNRDDFPTAADAALHTATCGWPLRDPDAPAPNGWFQPLNRT